MQGYIKDYRKELKSDVWLMPPLYHRVWQWLKYQANHEDKEIPLRDGSSFKIEKGQHLTSVRKIAQGVGWYDGLKWKEPNPKTISSILEWLEKQEMISIERGKGNRQYTLITLINWGKHQSKDKEGNSKETVNGEAGKQSMDINKNDKERSKNELKNEIYTIFEHWNSQKIVVHRELNQKRKSKINARLENGYTVEQMKEAIENYATVLKSDKYYWTYKWTLDEFLNPKNIDKFLSENNPFENFLKHQYKNKGGEEVETGKYDDLVIE